MRVKDNLVHNNHGQGNVKRVLEIKQLRDCVLAALSSSQAEVSVERSNFTCIQDLIVGQAIDSAA